MKMIFVGHTITYIHLIPIYREEKTRGLKLLLQLLIMEKCVFQLIKELNGNLISVLSLSSALSLSPGLFSSSVFFFFFLFFCAIIF